MTCWLYWSGLRRKGMKMQVNNIYHLDCLQGMRGLTEESIDLIYLDPPFFTQKKHKLRSKDGKEYEFHDIWPDIEAYKGYLKERLIEMNRVLKYDGNIFVHCDKNASHVIRALLEEIFGERNFRSEIIWTYKRWSNAKKGLLDAHQNIYHFSKSKSYKFNVIYVDYSPTTNVDQILQERARDGNGKSIYKRDDNGSVVYSGTKKGVPLGDVWEIPFLNPKAKERVGYPTQKPIRLLENILNIGSNEGDLVLDPFLGSGTCAVAAKLLKRRYMGFDINKKAIDIARLRLADPVRTESQLLKKGAAAYDTKTEREKRILSRYDCNIVQRNKGLDAILREKVNDKLVGIKIQKDGETLLESAQNLQNAMESKNFALGILIRTHKDIVEHMVQENIILIDDIDCFL